LTLSDSDDLAIGREKEEARIVARKAVEATRSKARRTKRKERLLEEAMIAARAAASEEPPTRVMPSAPVLPQQAAPFHVPGSSLKPFLFARSNQSLCVM
jgi:hypothetical protein